MQALDRRPVARPAGDRAEQEELIEVVAAAEAVAADQVGVFALQVLGRKHRAAEDACGDARRVALEQRDHAVGVALLDRVPVARRDRRPPRRP